jgi:hypothetical protein
VDEVDDDAADELEDGAAQLVPDERLERCLGRGHVLSLRRVVYTGQLGKSHDPWHAWEAN